MINIATPAATTTDWQPVVIGATGGSGTRAFHGIMGELGLFMGKRVNGAGDAMDFEPFLDRWINPIVSSQGRLDYDWSQASWWVRLRANAAFKRAMTQFQTERQAGTPWGWKNPRSMYVLPVIAALMPGIRFIHVVRDGRDMAFSDNQNQRRKHFAALFANTNRHSVEPDTPAASAALWATANMQVADWGERHLGQAGYRRIQLEELCADPANTVARLGEWLFPNAAPSGDQVAAAASTVKAPGTLGRWQAEPQKSQDAVTGAAQSALHRFGYTNG